MQYLIDNATEIAEAAKFVPLTEEQVEKAQNDVSSREGLARWPTSGIHGGRGGRAPRPAEAHRRGCRQGRALPLR